MGRECEKVLSVILTDRKKSLTTLTSVLQKMVRQITAM